MKDDVPLREVKVKVSLCYYYFPGVLMEETLRRFVSEESDWDSNKAAAASALLYVPLRHIQKLHRRCSGTVSQLLLTPKRKS